MFVNTGRLDIYKHQSEDSTHIGFVYYRDKILIINDTRDNVKHDWVKILYPRKGFVKRSGLITTEEKIKLDYRLKNDPATDPETNNWEPKLVYGIEDYIFIKKSNSYVSENVGLFKKNEPALCVVKDDEYKLWTKILYPVEGFVRTSLITISESMHQITASGFIGFANIPFEEKFNNHRIPLGINIEYTKTDWNLGFRAGWNNFQSNFDDFIIKNNLIYIQVRYAFLKFFQRKLNLYAAAGGTYYITKFQNTTYPSLEKYYPELTKNGFGLAGSVGAAFYISWITIDIQYFLFGTEQVTYGEPSPPGKISNYYHAYPMASQGLIMIGYRFLF